MKVMSCLIFFLLFLFLVFCGLIEDFQVEPLARSSSYNDDGD
uniref:Uncharacterized protein n=1 Tax=Rhizophora mucronata TaxID=61149 RepID=A0A2P2N7B9_RHIMU